MGLLKDITQLQPGIDSLAKQIGLYQADQKQQEVAKQTQAILSDTMGKLNEATGEGDTLTGLLANPLMHQKTISEAIFKLQSINPEAGKNVADWWNTVSATGINAQNAQSNAKSVDIEQQKLDYAKELDNMEIGYSGDFPMQVADKNGKVKTISLSPKDKEKGWTQKEIESLKNLSIFKQGDDQYKHLYQYGLQKDKDATVNRYNENFTRAIKTIATPGSKLAMVISDPKNRQLIEETGLSITTEKKGKTAKAIEVATKIGKTNNMSKDDVDKLADDIADLWGTAIQSSSDVATQAEASVLNSGARLSQAEENKVKDLYGKLSYFDKMQLGNPELTLEEYKSKYINGEVKDTTTGFQKILEGVNFK